MLWPGPQEWMIIILVVLLLFGASKIPEVARNLGRAKSEFRKGEVEGMKEVRELEKELKEKNEV